MIEAPLSRYKKNTLRFWIAICLVGAAYCWYDGNINKSFIEKHSKDGKADSTLAFNQKSPPYFLTAAAVVAAYYFAIRGRKLTADENELVIDGRRKISYQSVEKIDKTNFADKGFFVIGYKDSQGQLVERKISDRTYDNLSEILDMLISKIS